ncbi:Dedicator of cytokinesis protein 11 [Fasciola gigantica]|uniref:Dedicator of cytokinesis protein 11 n=1 Tax=Fasciola gigantica TaxID=46835 RepID=A0A504YVK4_FASGI|nr:Dedicator of cytokinesis protein 11 [Fasciola gigantica]
MSTHLSDSNNNNSCNITAVVDPPHQHRLAPGEMNGPRRLTDKCQRELFVCVLHIMSTVTEDHLTTLFHSFTVQERIHFLCMLTYAIQHLRYRGKKCIQQYEHISHSGIGRTGFGVSGVGAGSSSGGRRTVSASLRPPTPSVVSMHLGGESQSGVLDAKDATVQAGPNLNSDENEATSKVLLEANLATEAGLIVLDLVNTFTSVFKRQLESCKPSDPVFTGLLEVYVALLTNNPSECLLRHTFASLRVFVSRFAKVLFCESTEILSSICLTSLRCANQSLPMPSAMDSRNENSSNQSQTNSALPSAARSLSPRRESSQPLQTMNGIGMGPLSPTAMIRMEACGLLYKLWKSSYENFGRTGFYRVHLQTIISVSKLVTEIGPGFEASLSLLHTLVETDMRRGIGDTGAITPEAKFWSRAESRNMFVDDVNDLIRRVRTVLIATNEMRQHNDDHERLIDLQYCLAKSYSSNPALRRTWLDELAKLHMASKSLAELAMVKLHSAALMAEYLKSRSEFPQGCEAFSAISSNICQEENGLRTDSALLEIPYTQEDLLLDINEAATTLEAAGLFEAIRPVYALVIPVYEARQEYTALAQIYRHIGRAYDAIGHAEASGHRLFAAYFRVTFYGQLFESLANKSFIYRTNACQKLGGMCNELLTLYRNKYGQGVVDLLTDYAYNRETADSNKAYIQVNYVEPYKGPIRSGRPLTSFEKHHDVSQFMFETPFLLQPGMTTTASLLAAGPKHSDDLTQQWKRRTILTTSGTFPHLRRRLEVVHVSETDLCPIDAAIDAIECKNQELMTHVSAVPVVTPPAIDVPNGQGDRDAQQHRISVAAIGLRSPVTGTDVWPGPSAGPKARKTHRIPLLMDMQLQGALLPTVNVGPMAYAEAFLKAENQILYPKEKVARLRDLFFEFLTICLVLLTRYHHLMSSVHEAKYNAMRQSLDRYRVDLSNLLKEEIVIDEEKMVIGPRSVTSEVSSYVPALMETSVSRS